MRAFLLFFVILQLIYIGHARLPPSNAELWETLNVTLPALCQSNNVRYYSDLYPDPMLYMTAEKITTPYVRLFAGQEPTNKVLVVCGMSARGFATTEVCIALITKICEGKGDSDTLYTVVPYANPRGREIVHHLYGVFRGVSESFEYWQQRNSLPDKYTLTMGSLLPQSFMNRDIFCFDGTPRMTMLRNNFDQGWQTRMLLNVASTGMMPDVDGVSDNGMVPLSEPEARILEKLAFFVRASSLVIVETGVPSITVPYDSSAFGGETKLENAIEKSLDRARNVAKELCTDCIVGRGSESRWTSQSGTFGDAVMRKRFARRVYTLQIIDREYKTSVNGKVDCMRRIMPDTEKGMEELTLQWTRVVEALVKRE